MSDDLGDYDEDDDHADYLWAVGLPYPAPFGPWDE